MHTVNNYPMTASFYRTALLLGLLPGTQVIEWAESVLADDPDAPHNFSDIVSIPPEDITALRYALLGLCTEQVAEPIMRAIFGLVHRDFAAGKRNFTDTITVLSQFRRFVKLGREEAEQLLQFEMEVVSGTTGEAAEEFEARVRIWLEQFQKAEGETEMDFCHQHRGKV